LLADTFACMFLEQDIQNFKDEYFNTSWSVDSAGPKARERIAKWSMKISHFNFLVFTFLAFTSILILPLFGYHNEWILAIKVFEEYFGPWAKIPTNIRTLLDIVQSVMVVLIFLGVICSVTLLNFILNCGEDASNILKVRLIFSILTAQLISFMYCAAGQLLIDGTEQVHMILMNCPWYIWNIKNRKALLIFMCNCLEPFKISLAGIALDHKLIPSTIKAAYSYATFLYNLKNSK
ncbi:7tm 6 domain containing protein, partial [Asbolus verrucosus]